MGLSLVVVIVSSFPTNPQTCAGGNPHEHIHPYCPFDVSKLFPDRLFQAEFCLFPELSLESAPDQGA